MVYARRTTRPKPLSASLKNWAAPTGGWVSNRSLANPDAPGVAQGAAILDNFFPRASSVQLRRGKERYATLASDPLAMFSYSNGNEEVLFAATVNQIIDITGTPTVAHGGYTGGDWSVAQFATTGGVFLLGVNAVNTGFIYDGTTFASLAVTFTGSLTTADMAFVWVYKNRVWFAQKNSMNAWYLAIDSIAGAATLFPFAGIFGKGGELLFGAAWSLDTSDQGGLSEQCVFVSTKGEVAVFQGADPNSSTDWSKVGTYQIGTPLGKNAFVRGGGDLAVATSVGFVPLSKAITLDVTSLNVATISYNIADAWSDAILQRGLDGWVVETWPQQKMAFISPPDLVGSSAPVAFIANTETGAWCRYTNWRMVCMEVFQGQLFFGSPGGFIYKANETGMDDTMPYTGVSMPLFEDLNAPASLKIGKMARSVIRSLGPINEITALHVDFDLTPDVVPDAIAGGSDNLWGTGRWGTAIWGATLPEFLSQEWQSLAGSGYALSVATVITSGGSAPLDSELIRTEMTYTAGTVVS